MKFKLFFSAALVSFCLTASAQFRRSSDHKIYPYTTTLRSNDVMIIGRISPDTNYNFVIVSNLLREIGGVSTNNTILIASNVAISIFTNQLATNAMFEVIQTDGGTNFTIRIGTIYKKVISTNDMAFTNVTGVGSASVRILPNTADRFVYFPTNWAWLDTNHFTLSGNQWRTGVTNGASRIGWLSIVADGSDPTNVAAKWIATP